MNDSGKYKVSIGKVYGDTVIGDKNVYGDTYNGNKIVYGDEVRGTKNVYQNSSVNIVDGVNNKVGNEIHGDYFEGGKTENHGITTSMLNDILAALRERGEDGKDYSGLADILRRNAEAMEDLVVETAKGNEDLKAAIKNGQTEGFGKIFRNFLTSANGTVSLLTAGYKLAEKWPQLTQGLFDILPKLGP